MKRKSKNWVEWSVQSPLQKLIFGSSGQNLRKSRYQNLLLLSNFVWFSYLWQNILSLIVDINDSNQRDNKNRLSIFKQPVIFKLLSSKTVIIQAKKYHRFFIICLTSIFDLHYDCIVSIEAYSVRASDILGLLKQAYYFFTYINGQRRIKNFDNICLTRFWIRLRLTQKFPSYRNLLIDLRLIS